MKLFNYLFYEILKRITFIYVLNLFIGCFYRIIFMYLIFKCIFLYSRHLSYSTKLINFSKLSNIIYYYSFLLNVNLNTFLVYKFSESFYKISNIVQTAKRKCLILILNLYFSISIYKVFLKSKLII